VVTGMVKLMTARHAAAAKARCFLFMRVSVGFLIYAL
jgi:hypothetical protein